MRNIIGINTAIIDILRTYKTTETDIPIGFLAKELCRETDEIEEHLENLKKHKIVDIYDDSVRIVDV